MNIKCCLSVLCFTLVGSTLWAIPNAITYQGTLKEKGAPAKGLKAMTFQLMDKDGSIPYSNIISSQVSVDNGLFSVQLSFQLVQPYTWEMINPYLRVTVEGQSLSPTEAVNATVYALVSNTVVDGAITPAKVATGYGLIPTGMIAMFANSCPSGWSIFHALDGRFPVGADFSAEFPIGHPDGSMAHSHSLSITSSGPAGGAIAIGTVRGSGNNGIAAFGGPGGFTADFRSADTDSKSNLPPYLAVMFCLKN